MLDELADERNLAPSHRLASDFNVHVSSHSAQRVSDSVRSVNKPGTLIANLQEKFHKKTLLLSVLMKLLDVRELSLADLSD